MISAILVSSASVLATAFFRHRFYYGCGVRPDYSFVLRRGAVSVVLRTLALLGFTWAQVRVLGGDPSMSFFASLGGASLFILGVSLAPISIKKWVREKYVEEKEKPWWVTVLETTLLIDELLWEEVGDHLRIHQIRQTTLVRELAGARVVPLFLKFRKEIEVHVGQSARVRRLFGTPVYGEGILGKIDRSAVDSHPTKIELLVNALGFDKVKEEIAALGGGEARRRSPRFGGVELEAHLEFTDGNAEICLVRDIGRTGFRVSLETSVEELGEQVALDAEATLCIWGAKIPVVVAWNRTVSIGLALREVEPAAPPITPPRIRDADGDQPSAGSPVSDANTVEETTE